MDADLKRALDDINNLENKFNEMMAAALADAAFDCEEAGRLAALPSFDVLNEMLTLKREVANGK